MSFTDNTICFDLTQNDLMKFLYSILLLISNSVCDYHQSYLWTCATCIPTVISIHYSENSSYKITEQLTFHEYY